MPVERRLRFVEVHRVGNAVLPATNYTVEALFSKGWEIVLETSRDSVALHRMRELRREGYSVRLWAEDPSN